MKMILDTKTARISLNSLRMIWYICAGLIDTPADLTDFGRKTSVEPNAVLLYLAVTNGLAVMTLNIIFIPIPVIKSVLKTHELGAKTSEKFGWLWFELCQFFRQ